MRGFHIRAGASQNSPNAPVSLAAVPPVVEPDDEGEAEDWDLFAKSEKDFCSSGGAAGCA